jgi:hypothetical protein
MRNVYNILARKSEAKRPLGTPTRRMGDTIKINLKGTECQNFDRIQQTFGFYKRG